MISSPICRICGFLDLRLILSLGKLPLANALLTAEQLTLPEPTYPLDLAFCPHCTLVQITETVTPEKLFRDYLYFSSFSDTMLRHAQEIAHRLIESRSLSEKSLIIELGSNDGYLLQYFVAKGIPVLGIEPARNVAKEAEAKGVRTLCEFFDERLAYELRARDQSADVIIANNVLAHVADLNGFVEGIRILLNEEGVAIFEVPYVKDMIDRCEFDTIYHEHLCYYSLTALDRLFQRHELALVDVERIPVHGGSLRVFVAHAGQAQPSNSVQLLLREQAAWGVDKFGCYLDFRHKVEQVKKSLQSLLEFLKGNGKCVAAYGAAAKGTVLLNYCGIGKKFIDFVVDRSPYKQGRYMPGVHLPIYAPSWLLEKMPDYTLLLAWNVADEILAHQAAYVERGGRFIVPVPEPRIVPEGGGR